MDTIIALSYLALVWPILCSAQQTTYIIATLQLPNVIFYTTPISTAFNGLVSTSTTRNTELVTAYTIPCEDEEFALCQSITGYGQALEFTAITGSTTYDLPHGGTIICGVTDIGSIDSGTALCTATAGPGQYYITSGSSYRVFTDSSSYAIYFSSMDEYLASSLGAITTTYNPTSAATTSSVAATSSSAAATSSVAMTSASSTEMPLTISSSASTSMSSTTSATSTSASSDVAASVVQPAQTTSSSPTALPEHEKIGIGVGIAAFVLVCCAAGFGLKFYRQKRRTSTANPIPSELYFNTDKQGQASAK